MIVARQLRIPQCYMARLYCEKGAWNRQFPSGIMTSLVQPMYILPLSIHVQCSSWVETKLKPTIHEATFVASNTATLLFVRAAHEILNAMFYKLLENRQPVYFQATCRMYHEIFPCAAHTNNDVAVSPATKVASCMVRSALASVGTFKSIATWAICQMLLWDSVAIIVLCRSKDVAGRYSMHVSSLLAIVSPYWCGRA